MDTQLLRHYWLQEKGYRNCWGVGRHVLGSQIFDYWFDESGLVLEHYSDGDMVKGHAAYLGPECTPTILHCSSAGKSFAAS